MMRARVAFDALIAGLRGETVVTGDWQSLIALANHTLLTPALFASLERTGRIDQLPDDVVDYLRFIHGCNVERNVRLRRQLVEVVAALNCAGIVPYLLKGAVPIFLSPSAPTRITSDLDVAVAPAEEALARTHLRGLGYEDTSASRELVPRAGVAIMDLRTRHGNACGADELVEREGLRARIPTAESRALHWILHDLVKEGDYWRGRIDLRHMFDLVQLAESDGVDWTAVRTAAAGPAARNAVDAQLLALNELFGIPVPEACRKSLLVRLQHRRRLFAAQHALLGAPLRLAGSLIFAARRLLTAEAIGRGRVSDIWRRGHRLLFDRRSKI